MPLPEAFRHMLSPAAYPHPAASVRLIETHISWVLIAGDFAYKIKKPVELGFLDFSTVEKRRYYCGEEIRLNRRLAPEIYLDVVEVTDSGFMGAGEARDWAVKMRAFPADATMDREGVVTTEQIDAIADRVARFHGEIAIAPEESEYGSAEAAMYPVRENLRQIAAMLPSPTGGGAGGEGATYQDRPPRALSPALPRRGRAQINHLASWSEKEHLRLLDHFATRKAANFIRECHGDLHLGNIAWVDEAPLIFDCIEFNPGLRFIDVVSEVAFLCMDLTARDLEPLAWRFLNRYLEHTGDYRGLAAFRFYLAYRALVRAKVACIRASQGDEGSRPDVPRYLDLAERISRPGRPALLLMHGLSGSGKTWLSQRLLEALGAIRVRSDVERKRLYNLHALADSKAAVGDIYTPEAGRRTFAHLKAVTDQLLGEGFLVIVDATFLGRALRADFIALAEEKRIPWHIVSAVADDELLRERVRRRHALAADASEADVAVLESQMRNQEPLTAAEIEHQIAFPASGGFEAPFKVLFKALSERRSQP